jgi:hypothetical protein
LRWVPRGRELKRVLPGNFRAEFAAVAVLAAGSLLRYSSAQALRPSAGRNGDDAAYRYFAQKLMPFPLPTKDGGVLRTIGDVHAYMQALSKARKSAAAEGSVNPAGPARVVHGRQA